MVDEIGKTLIEESATVYPPGAGLFMFRDDLNNTLAQIRTKVAEAGELRVGLQEQS